MESSCVQLRSLWERGDAGALQPGLFLELHGAPGLIFGRSRVGVRARPPDEDGTLGRGFTALCDHRQQKKYSSREAA